MVSQMTCFDDNNELHNIKKGCVGEQTCKQIMICHRTGFDSTIQNMGREGRGQLSPKYFSCVPHREMALHGYLFFSNIYVSTCVASKWNFQR